MCWKNVTNRQTDRCKKSLFSVTYMKKVRYFRDTYGHVLALYIAQHHHKMLFLLLSCWTMFSWLILIRRCCCCSCCGRFRCVVCRCCLRGSYLIQCWHYPSQFKLPLPSLWACDTCVIYLNDLIRYTSGIHSLSNSDQRIQSNLASRAAPLSR